MFYSTQARKWLWLKLVGGVLLTIAFFLPTLEYGGCTATYQKLFISWRCQDTEMHAQSSTSNWVIHRHVIVDRLSRILFFFSPYAFGLLIALGGLCRFAGSTNILRSLEFILCRYLMFFALIPIAAGISGYGTYQMGYFYDCSSRVMSVTVGLILLVYLWRAHRRRESLFITSAWAGAAFYLYWCVAWYLYFCFRENNLPGDGPQIGLHLASLGFLTILIAATAEAILYTDLPWWRSLICLVTASLRRGPSDQPECKSCGYCLVGLTEPRCPECGTPFEPGLSTEDSTTQRL